MSKKFKKTKSGLSQIQVKLLLWIQIQVVNSYSLNILFDILVICTLRVVYSVDENNLQLSSIDI